ncbi:DUF3953 domain-containing protein [Jeotgalibacillus haloalkalitolerans]|uniref:DUF3953 domain-containing protein n=1 Tax=Jeotgalibacillus haloalkalitolerans TaxID=3104292 RepID=A0ABU5KNL8_9BACL|nr:DUF3953 domain-containing protein [Jeotgalibacillus sp. HH7-29]MDZ5712854.1 DUF3953 domain-containing protein [Jeotgalibacillus sp. HH7-29]
MRTIITSVLSGIVIIVAGYSLFTGDRSVVPFYMFPLALLLLITGIERLKENKTFYGAISIAVSTFVFFVAGYTSFGL